MIKETIENIINKIKKIDFHIGKVKVNISRSEEDITIKGEFNKYEQNEDTNFPKESSL